jgi:hypothetical protein
VEFDGMNIDLKDLSSKVQPVVAFLKRYTKFIYFIAMLLAATFLVFRINQLSNVQPSDDAITEKLQTVQRPRLDADALQKIQQLQDQNVQVQSLFEQARNNPFSE